MATLKFIIRKNKQCKNKDGTTLIFLRYTHKGQSVYFTTKKRINQEFWDQNGQKIKRAFKGHTTFNIYLSKFKQKVEDLVNEAYLSNEEPASGLIRRRFDQKDNANTRLNVKVNRITFNQFVEKFIEESKLKKKKSTTKTYLDVLRIINIYAKDRHIKEFHWEDFTMDWYDDFLQYYIIEKGVKNNTFGKTIKLLKAILNSATDKGYNSNLDFRKRSFEVLQEEVRNIYLNEAEIRTILDLDLSKLGRIELVRDLFVIACYTGLRFSDFKQINERNITNERLRVKTVKTGTYVVIPLHPIVKEVIAKYDGKLPKAYCNQVINRDLKIIGKMAGLNQVITRTHTYGPETKDKSQIKWELLSTHCARRSFATNLFKQGFETISIMKITGHKSEKNFMKYIKVTEDEVANMLEEHWNNNAKVA